MDKLPPVWNNSAAGAQIYRIYLYVIYLEIIILINISGKLRKVKPQQQTDEVCRTCCRPGSVNCTRENHETISKLYSLRKQKLIRQLKLILTAEKRERKQEEANIYFNFTFAPSCFRSLFSAVRISLPSNFLFRNTVEAL